MKSTLTDNELIEQFLLGRLTDKEVQRFKTRLEKDREFRRKYNLIRTFPEMMSEEGREELQKQQAEKLERETEKHSTGYSHRNRIIVLAAVAFVIITGMVLFLLLKGVRQKQENAVVTENPPEETIAASPVAAPVKDTQAAVINKPEQPVAKVIREDEPISPSGPVVLLTPDDGKVFRRNEPVHFSWKMETDSFTRFFIFSESREKPVLWRGIRPGVREYEVPGNYLYPGKFYWFVGNRAQKKTFIIAE